MQWTFQDTFLILLLYPTPQSFAWCWVLPLPETLWVPGRIQNQPRHSHHDCSQSPKQPQGSGEGLAETVQTMAIAKFTNITVMHLFFLTFPNERTRNESLARLYWESDINFHWPRMLVIKYVHLLSVTRLEMLGKLLYYSAKIPACH